VIGLAVFIQLYKLCCGGTVRSIVELKAKHPNESFGRRFRGGL
jgi:hypothetical protein